MNLANAKLYFLIACALLAASVPARCQDTNAAPATAVQAEAASTGSGIVGPAPKVPRAPLAPKPGGGASLPPEVLQRLSPQQIVELMSLPQRHREPDVNDIVFLITFPTFGFFIVLTVMIARMRRNRMLHQTLRMLIEKGAPIPAELLQPPAPVKRNDLRTGILAIGAGIGIAITLAGRGGHAWLVGFIPLFLGLAFLVTWKLDQPTSS